MLASMAVAGCVVAPPPDLPPQSDRRPTILHEAAQPALDRMLRAWPADNTFVVPVELGNPPAFLVDAFVDWSGVATDPPVYFPHAPDVSTADGGVVTVPVPLGPPPAPDTCHVVEILVVNAFAADESSQMPLYHTPSRVGGDTAVWFYSPSGGVGGCAPYDAGSLADASGIGDAAADGGILVPPSDGSAP